MTQTSTTTLFIRLGIELILVLLLISANLIALSYTTSMIAKLPTCQMQFTPPSHQQLRLSPDSNGLMILPK